jgi:hypothetical protein
MSINRERPSAGHAAAMTRSRLSRWLNATRLAAALLAVPVLANGQPGQGHAPPGQAHAPRPAGERPGPAPHPPAIRPGAAPHPPAIRPGPGYVPRGIPSRPPVVTGPLHLDQRYHHDHYYPGPGFTVRGLPAGSVSINWRNGTWFFHSGVWFRPVGPRFVVATPPAGIVVPMLPSYVVPLWVGGMPYYYANGVYYSPVPEGFAVVTPPPGAASAEPLPGPPGFIIYPRNGQSAAQTDADRLACEQWAGTQPDADRDASVLQRAFEACMDGRGYSVR